MVNDSDNNVFHKRDFEKYGLLELEGVDVFSEYAIVHPTNVDSLVYAQSVCKPCSEMNILIELVSFFSQRLDEKRYHVHPTSLGISPMVFAIVSLCANSRSTHEEYICEDEYYMKKYALRFKDADQTHRPFPDQLSKYISELAHDFSN